jgi:predicted metal-dependent peptidase
MGVGEADRRVRRCDWTSERVAVAVSSTAGVIPDHLCRERSDRNKNSQLVILAWSGNLKWAWAVLPVDRIPQP